MISELYKECEKIISSFSNGGKRVIIGIDGMAASGKTTLAAMLERAYGVTVFHTDDYFLPANRKNPERLEEVGGNIDYERFYEEIILPLGESRDVVMRRFDCKTQTLCEPKKIKPTDICVIEGAYSLHPKFGDIYTHRFVLKIDEEEQLRRIENRNGKEMLARFVHEWIPMENRYLKYVEETQNVKTYYGTASDIDACAFRVRQGRE